MVRVGVFEILADYCALEEGSVVWAAEGGDEAARVEGEEGGGFVVGVDFDVLVRDFLFFEDGPGPLDEGAAGEEVGELGIEDGPRKACFWVLELTYNQPE